jgi:hypothetical protein
MTITIKIIDWRLVLHSQTETIYITNRGVQYRGSRHEIILGRYYAVEVVDTPGHVHEIIKFLSIIDE